MASANHLLWLCLRLSTDKTQKGSCSALCFSSSPTSPVIPSPPLPSRARLSGFFVSRPVRRCLAQETSTKVQKTEKQKNKTNQQITSPALKPVKYRTDVGQKDYS